MGVLWGNSACPYRQRPLVLGQEGVVGKRADPPYRAGIQPTWRKVKNHNF